MNEESIAMKAIHNCNICHKFFNFHSSLIKHMRVHTGEKPYICEFEGCGLKFSQVSNLIRHKRIHSNIKPYSCEMCGKLFSSSSNLKQHTYIHSQVTNRNKYICFIRNCRKSYLYICTLKKHVSHEHKCELKILQNHYPVKNFLDLFKKIKSTKNCPFNFLNLKSNSVIFVSTQSKNEENNQIKDELYRKHSEVEFSQNNNTSCGVNDLVKQLDSSNCLKNSFNETEVSILRPKLNYKKTEKLNSLLKIYQIDKINHDEEKWKIFVILLEIEKMKIKKNMHNNMHILLYLITTYFSLDRIMETCTFNAIKNMNEVCQFLKF